MALDYGERRVGVAISDELQLIARPLTTIRREKKRYAQVALEFCYRMTHRRRSDVQ